ncbi:hypothetical protein [Spirosoma endophyticum]|nr:hypothetical protein [Spirosoma endophyticum]
MEANHQEIEAEKTVLRQVISSYDKSVADLTDLLPGLEKMNNALDADGNFITNVKESIGYLSNQRKQMYDYLNSL